MNKTFHFIQKIDITLIEDPNIFNILPVIQVSKLFGINNLDFRWGTIEISFHSRFNVNELVKTIIKNSN